MGWDEDAPDAGGVEELRRQVEALWLCFSKLASAL